MPDYSKGKIYTIRFIDNDNHIYIGSTCQSLAKRFGGHKIIVSSLYKYIQETYNGDWSKCYIELCEDFKCDNREQLNKREGEVIRDFMKNDEYNVFNQRIAGRKQKEYRQDNKEHINGKKKEYYQNKKKDIQNKQKEYYQNNKSSLLKKQKEYRRDAKNQ